MKFRIFYEKIVIVALKLYLIISKEKWSFNFFLFMTKSIPISTIQVNIFLKKYFNNPCFENKYKNSIYVLVRKIL